MPMDFCQQLRKQLRYLDTSCREYDAGNRDEAIRIATSLRVIFHATRTSISLLKHLKGDGVSLLSTCERIPKGNPKQFWANITNMRLDPRSAHAEFIPKLASARTLRYSSLISVFRGLTLSTLKICRRRGSFYRRKG